MHVDECRDKQDRAAGDRWERTSCSVTSSDSCACVFSRSPSRLAMISVRGFLVERFLGPSAAECCCSFFTAAPLRRAAAAPSLGIRAALQPGGHSAPAGWPAYAIVD